LIRWSTSPTYIGYNASQVSFYIAAPIPGDVFVGGSSSNIKPAKFYFNSEDSWAALSTTTLGDIISSWPYASVPGGASGSTGYLSFTSSVELKTYMYAVIWLDGMLPPLGEFDSPDYERNQCRADTTTNIKLALAA